MKVIKYVLVVCLFSLTAFSSGYSQKIEIHIRDVYDLATYGVLAKELIQLPNQDQHGPHEQVSGEMKITDWFQSNKLEEPLLKIAYLVDSFLSESFGHQVFLRIKKEVFDGDTLLEEQVESISISGEYPNRQTMRFSMRGLLNQYDLIKLF